MTYQEVLDFLYSQLPMFQRVGNKALNNDLTKTIKLHKKLGNPQDQFKSIHIAGTNGKGSTAHLIASILQEAGYKVGLYTSPHLKSFRERIRINGKMVDENFIVNFVEENISLIERIKPSFFEMTVAMAYKCFEEESVDIAVIESGLGGRLDSTNIIEPELSIITSIGLDHQDILGNTIEKIAREKAGIIKTNIPVIIGDLPVQAKQEIQKVADSKKSDCILGEDFYHVNMEQDQLTIYKKEVLFIDKIESDLKGNSTMLNLPIVLKSIDVLREKGFQVDFSHVKKGIEFVCLRTGLLGRWQQLSNSPITICDIGHNEEAVSLLMERLKDLNKPIHIVWGMNKDKSVKQIISLLPKKAKYYFCAAKIDRAMSAIELAQDAKQHSLMGEAFSSVQEAIESANAAANLNDVIFVGGSTFVVAELNNLT
ncbi:MAG: bifunctional folylpolyglutamate synthase/dihydrofolate synthase [Reichenbachiella sp.]